MGLKGNLYGLLLYVMMTPVLQAQPVYQHVISTSNDRITTAGIAINRKDAEFINVVTSGGTIFSSTDHGSSWSVDETLTTTDIGSWLFSNKKGDLFFIERTGTNRITLKTSGDRGETWKDLGEAELANLDGPPAVMLHPAKSDIFITYKRTTDCKTEIVAIQSGNGKKWTEPVSLQAESLPCDSTELSNANVAMNNADFLFAVWHQQGAVMLDRSFDKGERWLRSDIKVHDYDGAFKKGPVKITIDNSLSKLRGAIYVAWINDLGDGSMGPVVARSTNNGDFWTSRTPVSNVEGIDGYFPLLSVDQTNGMLYVAYLNKLAEETYDVYLAVSNDGGQTFINTKMNLEEVYIEDNDNAARSLSLDVHENRVVLSWSSFKDQKQEISIKSITYGELSKK